MNHIRARSAAGDHVWVTLKGAALRLIGLCALFGVGVLLSIVVYPQTAAGSDGARGGECVSVFHHYGISCNGPREGVTCECGTRCLDDCFYLGGGVRCANKTDCVEEEDTKCKEGYPLMKCYSLGSCLGGCEGGIILPN
jgi:hypothetical protein